MATARMVVAACVCVGLGASTACRAEATPPPAVDELVVYEPGNLPVILLAPHGGTVRPEGMPTIPDLPGADVATDELAREVALALTYTDAEGIERRPYLVLSRMHRRLFEPNRSWETDLRRGWVDAEGKRVEPHPRAERVHRDFHTCAEHAMRAVEREHGAGLLVDLHGLAATRKLDMYGYLTLAGDLWEKADTTRPTPDGLLAAALRKRSTLRVAAARKATASEVANLVRGPGSLAGLVDRAYRELYPDIVDADGKPRGRPATPSDRYPNPKGAETPDRDGTYFNGAYDILAHSSFQEGTRVDAVQIETLPDARNSKTARARFARALARALREFLPRHYGFSISPPAGPDAAGPARP